MDERVRKKRLNVNCSKDFMDMPENDEKDRGHSLKVESDIEKKRKHKDKKNKCSTDEVLNLNKVEEKYTGIAAKERDCSSEGDAMRNGEENGKSKRKKRKKGKDKDEIISGIIDGDNEMQFFDDKQERKTKKRKNRNDSIPEMQDGFALESRSENNEGANTHSVVTNNDDQREKINKKEKAKEKEANDEKDLGHSLKVESDIQKKRKRKDKKNKCSTDEVLNLNKVEEKSTGIAAKERDCSSEGDAMRNGEENNKSKRKKRKKGKDKDEIICGIIDGDNEMQFLDDKQERKTKKRKNCNESIPEMQDGFALESRSENNEDANTHSVVTNNDDQRKKINKKEKEKEIEKLTGKGKIIEDDELRNNGGDRASAESHEGDPHLTEINMGDSIEHSSSTKVDDQGKKKKMKKSKEDKRVKFSDQVEVFNDGLVQGKRFTKEEDGKIKEAIYSYIDAHGLGDHDQGVDMILHCSSYPKLRGCWKEIASALPHRPLESVYHRGHILFERDDSRKWTPEELEIIRKFHEKHGPNWKMLADAMGKHRFHVKDAWRRIKLGDVKKGHWSQDEYQKLFNLVNADLSMRALDDTRKYKHGMLRDNIRWEAIGSKVATRTSQLCCMKWYEKLTSPMVAEGEWADTDDYRLLNALYTLDACSMEEVEWDHLLEHRSGDVCRKRWNQMVQNIGEHGIKSFSDQVEILSERYRPDLVAAREAFDSKPVVP